MERRKDNKGRVLKEGESQRKDGLYQYRYTDKTGKRHTVYASDLKTLREKEKEIQKILDSNLDYSFSKMTVYELAKKYNEFKYAALSPNTVKTNKIYLKRIRDDPFGKANAQSITVSDAKSWIRLLYNQGASYHTVENIRSVCSYAFQCAYEDDVVAKNPFGFQTSKIIQVPHSEKNIISEEQYNSFIEFMENNTCFRKRVDEIIILHETGLRVSEFCGLTLSDVDLRKGTLKVDHQIYCLPNGEKGIIKPKSYAGNRIIPLTDKAKQAFQRIIVKRNKYGHGPEIDGYGGFLFLGINGNVRVGNDVNRLIKTTVNSYNRKNVEKLPMISPHTFRHMFCSRLVSSGMNVKSVQYFMGHSNAQVTLDIYSHVMWEESEREFFEALKEKP